MRKVFWFCIISFSALNIIAFAYRIFDAINYGDWQFAFVQDSFMGFPITHILSAVSFAFVGLAYWFYRSSVSQQERVTIGKQEIKER